MTDEECLEEMDFLLEDISGEEDSDYDLYYVLSDKEEEMLSLYKKLIPESERGIESLSAFLYAVKFSFFEGMSWGVDTGIHIAEEFGGYKNGRD